MMLKNLHVILLWPERLNVINSLQSKLENRWNTKKHWTTLNRTSRWDTGESTWGTWRQVKHVTYETLEAQHRNTGETEAKSKTTQMIPNKLFPSQWPSQVELVGWTLLIAPSSVQKYTMTHTSSLRRVKDLFHILFFQISPALCKDLSTSKNGSQD